MNKKSIYFMEEHNQFRLEVRDFLKKEVSPNLSKWEQARCIPKSFWQKMGQKGLFGLHQPKELGGSDKDFFYSVILLEELGRTGCIGFRVSIGLHAYMTTSYITHVGSEYLKKEYIAPSILGQKISALGISEAQSGSDLSELQTTAKLEGDTYLIDGHKKYVLNGSTADYIVLVVKTGNLSSSIAPKRGSIGLSLIVVDTDAKGIEIEKSNNIGVLCGDAVEMKFNQVQAPKCNLIGQPEKGFIYLMQCLQLERLVTALLAIGGIEHCIRITWSMLSKRRAYNKPLSKLQALRHKMADYVTELESVRHLTYHAAWLHSHKELPIEECSMAKLKTTELANRIAQDCLHLHGAYGYYNNSEISRIYRDAPMPTVGAGVNEVMRDIIAQITLDESYV